MSKNVGEFINNPVTAQEKLGGLIDWTYANDLEFHITELDYRIEKDLSLEVNYQKQPQAHKRIIDVLIEKSKNGLLILNLWDLGVRINNKIDRVFHSIYDEDFKPTPAYKVIKEALNHQF